MTREATQPATGQPSSNVREARARPWRMLSMTSGLLLAATFFLPAISIQGCSVNYSPAFLAVNVTGAIHTSDGSLESVGQILILTGLCIPAYLLGFLVALHAVFRMNSFDGLSRLCTKAIAILILGDCFLLLAVLLINIIEGGLPILQEIYDRLLFFVGYLFAPLLVLAYMIATIHLRSLRFISHLFIATLAACFWFAYWMLQSSASIRYGVYVSFAASCLLLLSSIGEARALTGHGWRRTIWLLLTCRLRKRPDGHCPQCDYYLFGLTVMRCPECGRPFNFEELGMSPDQLGFSGRLDHVVADPGDLAESE